MPKKIYLLSLLYSILLLPTVLSAAEYVQIVEETARSISFKVDVPEPVFVPAGDAHGSECSIEGFSLYNEPGMPGVVLRGVMTAIPPGSSVDINVAVHSIQDFKNIDLAPVPTLHSDGSINGGDDSFNFVKDLTVYRNNEYFPAQFAEVANTGDLRGMHFAQVRITPVQYNPVQRIVRVVRSMTVTLTFDGFDTIAARVLPPTERLASPAGKVFDTIRTRSIINPDSDFMDAGRVQVAAPAMEQLFGELQDSPFAIKIVTSAPGIHRVRYEDISGLGVDLSGLTNSNLKIENLGHEIAVYRSGTGQFKSGDYILFYAEDFQSEYSSTNVYWLYQGTGSGLTMQTVVSTPVNGFPQPASFNTVERFEQNLVWRRNLPEYVDVEDQWFWRLLNVFGVKTHTMTFTLKDFATDAGSFTIEMSLRGLTAFNHRTKVSLNGTQIADFEWTGAAIDRRILTGISPLLFNAGVNNLTVEALSAPGNEPTTPDQYYVNWAELTYARRYVSDANRLAFGADTSGGTTFEVSGFSEPEIMVFDVSNPAAPVELTGTNVSSSGGTARVVFERTVGVAFRFYALTPGASLVPKALIVDTPSDIRSSRTDIDYIIITHNQFLAEVEDLKAIREQGGLGVEIVDIQDIYDEFSYGIKDVSAIKDFLRYAYNNWHATDHPTYVVLVGDATYDYRDNLGRAADGKADLVPTYLGYRGSLGSIVGATASDNWFVCVDGDDPLPDMVIGRLCVKTIQDLQNIIDKIETYENSQPDEWQSRVLFAADSDDGDIFEIMAETLMRILPAAYEDLRLYLNEYGSDIATATQELIASISNGALITNYIGHGSTDTWSKSTWFQTPNQNTGITRDDVSLLTNTDKYTFLMVLNCLSGTFSEVTDNYSMAEEFVRQQKRGAVSCVAPSASGLPSHHSALGQSMYKNLFTANIIVGGALLTVSKIAAYQQTSSRDILETFNFFGDPALKLKVAIPEPECEVDADCSDVVFCNGDETCVSGVCVDGPGDPCKAGEVCNEVSDTCEVAPACEVDADCDGGVCTAANVCVECEVDADCGSGVCTAANVCVECEFDADCDSGVCTAGNVCVECEVDADCDSGVCTAANICVECEVDADCDDGVCTAANICVECEVDADCDDGFECTDGTCVKTPEVFRLLEPSDGVQLSEEIPVLFLWNQGPHTLFKVQFSQEPIFEPKKSYFITPRKNKNFIEQPYYTPSNKEWRKVRKFFKRSGIVYWRVLAYDAVMLSYITHTEYRSFVF